MQPYELFIGLRYTRARQRNRFISFISLISMIGIALGMTVLITVLSVMNGFQREVRTRILGVASHVQIIGPDEHARRLAHGRRQGATEPAGGGGRALCDRRRACSRAAAPCAAPIIRGIVPEAEEKVADLAQHMKAGSLDALKPGEFGIVLGHRARARAGRRLVGDKVVLIAPQGQVTPAGIMPRLRQFTVVGIFNVDHYEYDSGLALVHLEDAQKLYRMGEQVSGVRLKLKDLFRGRRARELSRDASDPMPTSPTGRAATRISSARSTSRSA